MSWDRERIESALHATAHHDPEPDAAFLARTEARLRSAVRIGTAPQPRLVARAPRLAVALGAVAAMVAAVIALGRGPAQEVQLLPAATRPTTTSSLRGLSTTLVPDPELRASTSTTAKLAPAASTTSVTSAPRTTTENTTPRTRPTQTVPPGPRSTTTRKPQPPPTRGEPQPMRMSCRGGRPDNRPGVLCEWSLVDGAAGYRLFRAGDGETKQIFMERSPQASRFMDRDVRLGQQYTYKVEAVASDGRVVGRSALTAVDCC